MNESDARRSLNLQYDLDDELENTQRLEGLSAIPEETIPESSFASYAPRDDLNLLTQQGGQLSTNRGQIEDRTSAFSRPMSPIISSRLDIKVDKSHSNSWLPEISEFLAEIYQPDLHSNKRPYIPQLDEENEIELALVKRQRVDNNRGKLAKVASEQPLSKRRLSNYVTSRYNRLKKPKQDLKQTVIIEDSRDYDDNGIIPNLLTINEPEPKPNLEQIVGISLPDQERLEGRLTTEKEELLKSREEDLMSELQQVQEISRHQKAVNKGLTEEEQPFFNQKDGGRKLIVKESKFRRSTIEDEDFIKLQELEAKKQEAERSEIHQNELRRQKEDLERFKAVQYEQEKILKERGEEIRRQALEFEAMQLEHKDRLKSSLIKDEEEKKLQSNREEELSRRERDLKRLEDISFRQDYEKAEDLKRREGNIKKLEDIRLRRDYERDEELKRRDLDIKRLEDLRLRQEEDIKTEREKAIRLIKSREDDLKIFEKQQKEGEEELKRKEMDLKRLKEVSSRQEEQLIAERERAAMERIEGDRLRKDQQREQELERKERDLDSLEDVRLRQEEDSKRRDVDLTRLEEVRLRQEEKLEKAAMLLKARDEELNRKELYLQSLEQVRLRQERDLRTEKDRVDRLRSNQDKVDNLRATILHREVEKMVEEAEKKASSQEVEFIEIQSEKNSNAQIPNFPHLSIESFYNDLIFVDGQLTASLPNLLLQFVQYGNYIFPEIDKWMSVLKTLGQKVNVSDSAGSLEDRLVIIQSCTHASNFIKDHLTGLLTEVVYTQSTTRRELEDVCFDTFTHSQTSDTIITKGTELLSEEEYLSLFSDSGCVMIPTTFDFQLFLAAGKYYSANKSPTLSVEISAKLRKDERIVPTRHINLRLETEVKESFSFESKFATPFKKTIFFPLLTTHKCVIKPTYKLSNIKGCDYQATQKQKWYLGTSYIGKGFLLASFLESLGQKLFDREMSKIINTSYMLNESCMKLVNSILPSGEYCNQKVLHMYDV